jgi:hypothetical protein
MLRRKSLPGGWFNTLCRMKNFSATDLTDERTVGHDFYQSVENSTSRTSK